MSEEIDLNRLFSLIEERPVLWDKTLDLYKDRNATKKAWMEVCTDLRTDFEILEDNEKNLFGKEVMRKWGNIRDAYAKSCKRENESKRFGAGALKTKKYVYSKELQFLSKFYETRDTEDSFNIQEGGEEQDNGVVFFAPFSSEPSSSFTVDVGQNDVSRKRSRKLASELSSSYSSRTGDLGQNDVSRKRSRESDLLEMRLCQILEEDKSNRHMSFFRGILPSLEKFEEPEVLKFQMGVLQVISKIQRETSQMSATQNVPVASHAHAPSCQHFQTLCQPSSSMSNSCIGRLRRENFNRPPFSMESQPFYVSEAPLPGDSQSHLQQPSSDSIEMKFENTTSPTASVHSHDSIDFTQ